MPFDTPAQQAVNPGDEPCLDTLWNNFARQLDAIYQQAKQDSSTSVQHALRRLTQETYNQLVYDEDFLAAMCEGSDPDLCELPVNIVPLFNNDTISVGLMSVYRNCGVVPLHDHPGAYGVTLVLSGIAKVTYASVIERDDEDMVRLRIDMMRERLPGQVCWFFDGERDLHSIESTTSSAQLLVINTPLLHGQKQSFYQLANQQPSEGATTIARRVPANQAAA
jgi:hypothetical protein